MTVIKKYKHNRRIIGYITHNTNNTYSFHTGKPSDYSCLGWVYSTLEDALRTGEEYYTGYTQKNMVCISSKGLIGYSH